MSNVLENQVKALVARHFGVSPSKVRLDDSFVGELGGDALDLVELGWEIEAAFDVALTPGVRDSLVSCRAVVEWLKEGRHPTEGVPSGRRRRGTTSVRQQGRRKETTSVRQQGEAGRIWQDVGRAKNRNENRDEKMVKYWQQFS